MKITKIGLFLFTLISFFSCKQDKNTEDKVEENQVRQEGTIDINYEYPSISEDSVKVSVKYISNLDTINLTSTAQRYTLLYLTQNDVSLTDLEKMIKEENTIQLKEEDVRAFDLRGNDSIHFYYKLNPNQNHYPLKIIIDDIVFLKDYNEKGQTRMIHHLTHFKEEIRLAQ